MANLTNIDDDKENVDADMEVVDDEETDEEETDSSDEETENATSRVYLPNTEDNSEVELECDESAYICYYAVKTGSPCLSFDIIPDSLGDNRIDQFPLSMTLVGGTEVKKIRSNNLLVMKLSNMQKNKPPKSDNEEDEESESESDEEEDSKPILETASVKHAGCVNRVKVTNLGGEVFAASWSELQKVHIWNLSRPLNAVNDKRAMAAYIQNNETVEAAYTFSGHQAEGFAMEWSPLVPGVLATGDCKSNIHLWKPLEGGSWHVDQRAYKAHTDSVEDIAWSPNESNTIRMIDEHPGRHHRTDSDGEQRNTYYLPPQWNLLQDLKAKFEQMEPEYLSELEKWRPSTQPTRRAAAGHPGKRATSHTVEFGPG
ncbi:Glutamate-rich WD repeat-containing protein 1 [Araneus ventricosus]|uniref:Glutamate-rich WD repeat-containing protein 1 n=1 Tax=Araneus ventricosus TaxID=182803 RepID=A0A4Y2P6H6_ARAVE|nr:Glutamate-rich WD repeat-containing protein 1 [Araneus ventricosus]